MGIKIARSMSEQLTDALTEKAIDALVIWHYKVSVFYWIGKIYSAVFSSASLNKSLGS